MNVRRLLASAALLLLPWGAAADEAPPLQEVSTAMAGWPLAEFAVQDQHGAAFTQARLLGRWTFVLLGDTRCGAPCDAALAALAAMNRRIAGTAKGAQVLFVSAAPAQEPPGALAAYLDGFDAQFIGLSGTPAALAPLLADLAPERAEGAGGGAVPAYGGALFLVGPDGALRGEFLPPFDVRRLTQAYLKLRLRG